MTNGLDKLAEMTPAALAIANTTTSLKDAATKLVAQAARFDRLADSMMKSRVSGCKVTITTTFSAGIIATELPKKLQMEIVEMIKTYYREDCLQIFDDIQRLKEDL